MRKLSKMLVALISITMFSTTAIAQDLPKVTKRENVQMYLVSYNKFKSGKIDEARKMISDYFIPTDKKANIANLHFQQIIGEWHHIIYFPLENGATDLNYVITPLNVKWWKAFAELVGGSQKAYELAEQWYPLVDKHKSELVFMRL